MAKGETKNGGDASRFAVLVESLLDGRISAEGEAELVRCLRSDASLVTVLAETLLSEQALGGAFLLDRSSDDRDWLAAVEDAVLMSSLVDEAIESRRLHEIEEKARQLLASQQAEGVRERGFELRRRAELEAVQRPMVIPRGLIWLGLAAAIGLAVWLGWPQAPTAVKDAPVVEAPVQPESPARIAVAPVPGTVATLLRTSGMVWGETMPQGQAARAGQPGARLLPGEYDLESGVVELVFDQGAAVIVEAPATFTLTGANELSLGSGKLVANVPPTAYGFTARAPGMDIVDLGTEFALRVEPGRAGRATDASTQVQVFTGRVKVRPSDSGGADFPEELVHAGESRQLQADGHSLLAGIAEPHAFYRAVPDAYERMVRALDPVVYWRFEDDNGQAFTDRVGHGSGQVETAGTITAIHDAPVGSGARFSGDGLVALRSPTGLGLTRDYTLALWVRMDSGAMERQRFVGNPQFVDGVWTSGFGLGVTPDDQAGGYHPLLTHYGVADYTTDLTLTVGRWHHLAVTVDSRGQPTFYLDGRPAGARLLPNVRGQTDPAPARANNADLIIGQPIDPEGFHEGELAAKPFRGGLDELVIYPTVLSAHQIAGLARTEPPGDGSH